MNIETLFNTSQVKRFHFPGTVIWGSGAGQKLADIVADAATVGLFVDVFFEDHPFVKALRASLGARLAFQEICQGMPRSQPLEILAERVSPPDAIISIGGGSTIDAAKAVIGHWLYGTFDGVGMGARRGMAPLPGGARPLLIGVPTTAGTGADASRYYVTYDVVNHGKVHGKSWRLIADWIVLDPGFVRNSELSLLVNSAFDAFVHFFESFICRQERSWFGDMLSLDGMVRLLSALDRIIHRKQTDDETFLELLYAATMGGIAISNIRTGNIHEAAGALLEHTKLSHSETLMVFLRPAWRQYRAAIADREALLMRRLAIETDLDLHNFDMVFRWWEGAFDTVGLSERIRAGMSAIKTPLGELRAHIINRVVSDRVWCTKESPVPLSDAMVYAFVDEALLPYDCGADLNGKGRP